VRRAFGLAAAVLLLLASGLLFLWLRSGPGVALETATITGASGSPLWSIKVVGAPRSQARLDIQTHRGASPAPGEAYELWALPKGGKPVSLGVLPALEGPTLRALTAAQRQALALAEQVAVSIEPPGGSPTGQPTGRIAFVSALHRPAPG
jgi:anti-sigma-K factor RskA